MKIKFTSKDCGLTVWQVKRKSDGKYLGYSKEGKAEHYDTPYKYNMSKSAVESYFTMDYKHVYVEDNQLKCSPLEKVNLNDYIIEEAEPSWTIMTIKDTKDLPKHHYEVIEA